MTFELLTLSVYGNYTFYLTAGSLFFSQNSVGVMRRDILAKGEWDETWHPQEEKQTADSSHIFGDSHTCQK